MRRAEMEQIRVARTCYQHLAGRLAVSVTEALVAQGLLELVDKEYRITAKGEEWFLVMGIDLEPLRKKRRLFAPVCMDWTERRSHLAGALGDELAMRFFELR